VFTTSRPVGRPAATKTRAHFTWKISGIQVVYRTDYNGFCLYPQLPSEASGRDVRGKHLYVWREDNRFKVEFSPGDFDVQPDTWHNQVLLATMFIGPPSDEHRNKMYNGYSPTRLDLGRIPYGRVWLHCCSWGREATAEVAGPEADLWRKCYYAMYQAQRGLFPADDATPLSELHAKVLSGDTAALLTPQAEILANLLVRITESEIWKKGRQIQEQTRG
jgi:hypothetical protein